MWRPSWRSGFDATGARSVRGCEVTLGGRAVDLKVVWDSLNVLEKLLAIAGILVGGVLGIWRWWCKRRARRVLETDEYTRAYTSDQIRHATLFYVEPDCASIDPADEEEIRNVAAVRHPIFETLDQYLNNPKYRFFILLADSGMGKTAFALNFYARNRLLPTRMQRRIAVVPLGI